MKRKGQSSDMMSVVIIALLVPIILTLFYLVQVSTTNSTKGSFTKGVTDYSFAAVANNTAQSLGQNYVYEDAGLTFNGTGTVTEGTNYTVDWDAGELTWIGPSLENDSTWLIDYEYFEDDQYTTFTGISEDTDSGYELGGVLPIALVGIAILVALMSAVGAFVFLKR